MSEQAQLISLNQGYSKRFPSDFSLDYETFLNNKGINAEVYAIFLGVSKVLEIEGEKFTYVYRGDINKSKISAMLGITRPTLNTRIKTLIDKGYLIEDPVGYKIIVKENCYLDIPVETLWYLQDTLKEEVIKTYIYLGVRYNYKKDYQFTLEEIGIHCGVSLKNNYQRNYVKLNNILAVLKACGLINFKTVWIGKEERKELFLWKSRPVSLDKTYQK